MDIIILCVFIFSILGSSFYMENYADLMLLNIDFFFACFLPLAQWNCLSPKTTTTTTTKGPTPVVSLVTGFLQRFTAPFDGVRSRGKSTEGSTPPLRIKSADEGRGASGGIGVIATWYNGYHDWNTPAHSQNAYQKLKDIYLQKGIGLIFIHHLYLFMSICIFRFLFTNTLFIYSR